MQDTTAIVEESLENIRTVVIVNGTIMNSY